MLHNRLLRNKKIVRAVMEIGEGPSKTSGYSSVATEDEIQHPLAVRIPGIQLVKAREIKKTHTHTKKIACHSKRNRRKMKACNT